MLTLPHAQDKIPHASCRHQRVAGGECCGDIHTRGSINTADVLRRQGSTFISFLQLLYRENGPQNCMTEGILNWPKPNIHKNRNICSWNSNSLQFSDCHLFLDSLKSIHHQMKCDVFFHWHYCKEPETDAVCLNDGATCIFESGLPHVFWKPLCASNVKISLAPALSNSTMGVGSGGCVSSNNVEPWKVLTGTGQTQVTILTRAAALRMERMMTCGWTPSSIKALVSFNSSPARSVTDVVPSPTW